MAAHVRHATVTTMPPTDGSALLGARTRDRLDAIVEDLMERQWYEVPEFWVTDDPAYREAVLRSTRENCEQLFDLMIRPGPAPRTLCAGARLEVAVAAQYGASAAALVRTYHIGEHALAEHLLETLAGGGVQSTAAALRDLRRAMAAVHAYMTAVTPMVEREHAAECARRSAHPDLQRLRLVQAAIAGDVTPALDYPLTGAHVAVVASSERAERAIESAAGELGSPVLAVRCTEGHCWAWVATDAADEVVARLRRSGADGAYGVGGPGSFRAAHEQALLAERIARTRRPLGVIDLRSVALEALALGDQRTALAVARAELGPLADAGHGVNHDLRTTLEAWFAAEESLAAAADRLGLAPRTVTYRLRRVEALLGHTIAARRAELEAALRVERLLAPPAA